MALRIDDRTVGDVFDAAAEHWGDNAFLVVPRDADRAYDANGRCWTFAEARARVSRLAAGLAAAGYRHGHRVAVLLENRPEILLLKLACNRLGVSWVPINPDYRVSEIAYLLADSDSELVIVLPDQTDLVKAAIAEIGRDVPCRIWDSATQNFPTAARAAPSAGAVHPQFEASLLYTSGTTGRPKGCIMGHEYELMMGEWYATRGGAMNLQEGGERLYNPLPLFHVNAAIAAFYGMMLSGNCLVVPERFSASRWWSEIRETQATGCHYLGVVIPVLMNRAPSERDRDHTLRWGFGAGVEPTLHRAFEERFGFPLVEGWGMTEMCRILADAEEPRQIDTRAMGRPQPNLEVRVVDSEDHDVPVGVAGEMVVRHSEAAPRKGAFSGYLNQSGETEHGWRGGWWHTGDTVCQDETGMIYFIDRKKNIIRRSGENIAAAEVEAILQGLERVAQVAVLPVEDEMRDEEVLAAVVLSDCTAGDAAAAQALFAECYRRLAYYKAPGWIVFVDELPVTGTQKVLKHMIFGEGVDPRKLDAAHDLRQLKKR